MTKFSFVIPAYNGWANLHALLFDIYKNCSKVHEVLVMDDISDEESFLGGISWWKSIELLPLKHIRQKENLGFLKNSNIGLKQATGDIICLVSTDVRIHGDIVGHWLEHNTLMGGRLIDWDSGWNTFKGITHPYIEGWLLAAHNKDWQRLGYFDERYMPNDYEDIDLSTMAKSLGMDLKVYPNGYVSHIGAQSIPYGDNRQTLTERNRDKFEKKWVK